MKILSIGNSFSQDAHKWLHSIAKADDFKLDTFNLYIGGCSLEMHWNNYINDTSNYELQGNNGEFLENISLSKALKMDIFDVVTIQQVSGLSGQPQSYFPYLANLAGVVRKAQPDAKIYFHKTWSYEIDSSHPSFLTYNNDQKEMYRRLCDASDMVKKIIDVDIIPTGDVIQRLRENSKEFNYKNGGISLCRDGFHLSLDYGRLAAGCVWYKTITGNKVNIEKVMNIIENLDVNLTETIMNCIEVIQ